MTRPRHTPTGSIDDHVGLDAVQALMALGLRSMYVATAVGAGMPLRVRVESHRDHHDVWVDALNYDKTVARYGRGWADLYDWMVGHGVKLVGEVERLQFQFVVPRARPNPALRPAQLSVDRSQGWYTGPTTVLTVVPATPEATVARVGLRATASRRPRERRILLFLSVAPARGPGTTLEDVLDPDGTVHWFGSYRGPRFTKRGAARKMRAPARAVDRLGALIDAMLALYVQGLPDGSYALQDFP